MPGLALTGKRRTVSAMSGTDIATDGNATESQPLCYRLPEAGRILGGISRRKVHDLIEAGDLEITKVGHLRMVTRASLEAYVERNRVRVA